jgi:hypothetical protein
VSFEQLLDQAGRFRNLFATAKIGRADFSVEVQKAMT